MTARMLAKAGTRRMTAGSPAARRKCICDECDLTPDPKTQRTRERREWMREAKL